MAPAAGRRPAHRPSRRASVVEAAMRLFSRHSSEAVTVADIAQEAGMTSAAVYYHYASKDDILLEGLTAFGEALLIEAQGIQLEIAATSESLGEFPVRLLTWVDEHRAAATVYFVSSSG